MASSAEQIACRIRDAYAKGPLVGAQAQAAIAAEKIEIQHVPAHPADGLWDGSTWATQLEGAVKAMQTAIPDLRQEVEASTDGDEIQLATTLTGTLPDGRLLDHRIKSSLTVRDGRIVKGVSYTDAG